jgi:hypothetical protein
VSDLRGRRLDAVPQGSEAWTGVPDLHGAPMTAPSEGAEVWAGMLTLPSQPAADRRTARRRGSQGAEVQ